MLNNFAIIIIIIVAIILLILLVIGIILFIKKIKKRELKNNHQKKDIANNNSEFPFERKNTDNAFSEQNEINDERKKEYLIKENKVKTFCDIILKPVKYSKVNIYNKICTIDLIAFNQNDEISVTNCSHGFHFNCIRKYLLENVNKKKVICCPNCGHPILDTS